MSGRYKKDNNIIIIYYVWLDGYLKYVRDGRFFKRTSMGKNQLTLFPNCLKSLNDINIFGYRRLAIIIHPENKSLRRIIT